MNAKPLRALTISGGYLLLWAGLGGLGAAFEPSLWVSPWYPGHALSLALVAVFGPRYMPLLFLARLLAGLTIMSEPPLSTVAAGIAIMASYGLAGWFLHVRRTDLRLGTMRAAVEFLGAELAASLVLPAILGPVMVATGAIAPADIWPRMIACAIGDSLATFGLGPLVLRGAVRGARLLDGAGPDTRDVRDERHGLMAIVVLATLAAIAASAERWNSFGSAPVYLVAIPAIWAAFVFGSAGAAAVVAAVNLGVPFAQQLAGGTLAVQDTQLLLGVVSVMSILLGAAITELRHHAVELATQRAALEASAAATQRLYEVQSTLSLAEAIAGIGCYRSDRRTGEVWWSDELYRILGRDPATFKPGGEFFIQITHPDDRPVLREVVDRIKSGVQPPGPILTTLRVIRGDGALRHVRIAREVVYGADDKISHVTGIVEDVTRDVETRDALAESEARLGAVAANVPGMVFRYVQRPDGVGAFTYVSDGVRRLLGLEPADVVRRADLIFDRVHPDDHAALDGAMRESARAVSPCELVVRFTGAERDVWVHGAAQTRRQPDGTILWDGVLLDVTAEKDAERELGRNEERFRFLTALAPMALAVIGRDDGRVRYANRACEHMFGYSVGRMEGLRVTRLMADPAAARTVGRELRSGDAVMQREIALRRQDGDRFTGLFSLMRGGLRDDDEIVACGLDVSELNDAQSRLERQSRVLEERVRELHCRYVMSRLTHDGARGVDAICRDLVDLLRQGWPQGDRLWVRVTLRGDTYVSGVPYGEALDRASVRAGHETVGEVELGACDSGIALAPCEGEEQDLLGSAARQIGHMIFEREASARLALAQRLESIGQLSGGIAHDFNNLLTVIFGNLELAEDRAKDDVSLKKCLANAQDAARRAAELTGQLLAFSRRQALTPEPLDLNALIARICEPFRRSLGEGIDVATELAAAPARVRVDRVQMEATILHLAVNARDAMAGGGRVTFATREVELGPEDLVGRDEGVRAGRYVELTIADTGGGIPPEVLGRVFDPFFTTKEVGQGTGLGLSAVFGFVKQSGGFLTVASEPGHGTTFRIFLPAAEADDTTAPVASGPADDESTRDDSLHPGRRGRATGTRLCGTLSAPHRLPHAHRAEWTRGAGVARVGLRARLAADRRWTARRFERAGPRPRGARARPRTQGPVRLWLCLRHAGGERRDRRGSAADPEAVRAPRPSRAGAGCAGGRPAAAAGRSCGGRARHRRQCLTGFSPEKIARLPAIMRRTAGEDAHGDHQGRSSEDRGASDHRSRAVPGRNTRRACGRCGPARPGVPRGRVLLHPRPWRGAVADRPSFRRNEALPRPAARPQDGDPDQPRQSRVHAARRHDPQDLDREQQYQAEPERLVLPRPRPGARPFRRGREEAVPVA